MRSNGFRYKRLIGRTWGKFLIFVAVSTSLQIQRPASLGIGAGIEFPDEFKRKQYRTVHFN